MAIKKYLITFAHLLKVKNGKPSFIISAYPVVALNKFNARVAFYRHHSSKTNKILSVTLVVK